ncbi:MAG: site-specific DNA-methyltransferase [Planctomycetaceae bacterium]|jgi:DNA modification methylase|nr:site-specific DNA-methyltransferase [Planctomycetaceae bacterium]
MITTTNQIICDYCLSALKQITQKIDMTFLDPPFNQQKDYSLHDDNMPEEKYWAMMKDVCQAVYHITNDGGCVYFMQREKNTEFVLQTLRQTGWQFQNLIIWKKRTSAVPVKGKYGKQFQIIVYAAKGERAKTFHRLRIDPDVPASYKVQRENGVFVTDVWDDIREMTSGYFAGDEALRKENGERFHKQQSPFALLLRMILTSTNVGDTVLDPFAGTGTTAVVAQQIQRHSVTIEIDPQNVECIRNRLATIRPADNVRKYYDDYIYTENLANIWGEYLQSHNTKQKQEKQLSLIDALG